MANLGQAVHAKAALGRQPSLADVGALISASDIRVQINNRVIITVKAATPVE